MLTWVGHEEVKKRMVKPYIGWKRFEYLCNGQLQYIYCLNKETFISLFEGWSRLSMVDGYVGRYTYTLTGVEGKEMTLGEIIMDRPEGTEYRCKIYLFTQHGEYIQ
jgi:hypothetical protein